MDPGKVTTELDDGGCFAPGKALGELVIGQSGGHDAQNVAPRGERETGRRGACPKRRDARYDLAPEALAQAAEEIHERPVEERIALAEHRNVASGIEMRCDVVRRLVIDRL